MGWPKRIDVYKKLDIATVFVYTFLALIMIGGCSTPYQPRGFRGGYSEIKLTSDQYIVSFKGNGSTGSDTVRAYVLYRSAEITLSDGYDYFLVIEGGIGSSVSTYTSSGSYQSSTTFTGTGSARTTGTFTPGQTYFIRMHEGTLRIKLFKEGEQPNDINVFNALELRANLDPHIRR